MGTVESIHHSHRLVLRGDDAEDVVAEFAQIRLGWPPRHRHPEDRDAWLPYEVTWYAGPGIQLTYTKDLLSDVRYVHITGADPNVVRVTTEITEAGLNTLRRPELLQAVAEATEPEEMAYAVLQAGLGAPQDFDEAFFTRLTTAMRSDSLMVREASIWAVTYIPWSAYLDPLTQMAETEPDEVLARTAWHTVEEFRANMATEVQ